MAGRRCGSSTTDRPVPPPERANPVRETGVNTPAAERDLEKYIETPYAIMEDKIVAAGADLKKIEAAFAELPHTALTGIYWLQFQRNRDARRAERNHHLNDFARRRIVVPPEIRPDAESILTLREIVREKFRLISVAGRMFAPTTWG